MKNWSLDDVENGNEEICEKNNSNDPYGLLLLFVLVLLFSLLDSQYFLLPLHTKTHIMLTQTKELSSEKVFLV